MYSGPMVWTDPGPAFDASTARGKSVMLIGSDFAIPFVQTESKHLGIALEAAGVTYIPCDGKGNPVEDKRCADDAIARGISVIALESVPPGNITDSLNEAKKRGIFVIDVNNGDPSESLYPGEDARVALQYTESGRLTADAVIVDSGGQANVLIVWTSDILNATGLVDGGMVDEFTKLCPKCKVTLKNLPIAQWATNLQTLTQSSLLADPSIKYVIPVYDAMSTFVLPGILATGSSDVKIATFNADLAPMQDMASGRVTFVDVGSHLPYLGWAIADQALRLMTGNKPVDNELVPIRVFDRTNVVGLTLSASAYDTGEWYGDPLYVKGYEALWGLNK
jgi:ribose transport system substrate-binding protein